MEENPYKSPQAVDGWGDQDWEPNERFIEVSELIIKVIFWPIVFACFVADKISDRLYRYPYKWINNIIMILCGLNMILSLPFTIFFYLYLCRWCVMAYWIWHYWPQPISFRLHTIEEIILNLFH